MRLGSFVFETASTLRSKRVSTLLTACLVAAMCTTALITVGRTAAAETQVASSLDAAGARLLTVTDAKDLGFLTGTQVAAIDGLSSVEVALGRSPAFDVRNAALGNGGSPAAAWVTLGSLEGAVRLVEGRWPEPGEAIVARQATDRLGMTGLTGELATADRALYPVVGVFDARAGFVEYAEGALIAGADDVTATTLQVMSGSASSAAATERAVLANLDRSDPTELVIESPTSIADLQAEVLRDLGTANRGLLALTILAGGFLVSVVVLADVLFDRVDIGRRRALGASRATVVALVASRSIAAGTAGALAGCITGAITASLMGQTPPFDFVLGVAVLSILATAVGSLTPAIIAARQDPVIVLRTP